MTMDQHVDSLLAFLGLEFEMELQTWLVGVCLIPGIILSILLGAGTRQCGEVATSALQKKKIDRAGDC